MKTIKYKIIKFAIQLLLITIANANAQWQLTFSEQDLSANKENIDTLNKLIPLLKNNNIDDNEAPIFEFIFNKEENAEEYWQAFIKYLANNDINIDATYSIHPEKSYSNEQSNQLIIYLKTQKKTTNCPGKIILYDSYLPLPQQGLAITTNSTIKVSKNAKLIIQTTGNIRNEYFVFAHQKGTNDYRDIRQIRSKKITPQLAKQGESYYLIAVPNGVNVVEIEKLQHLLLGSNGQYRQLNALLNLDYFSERDYKNNNVAINKAFGLNSISFSPLDVIDSSQNTTAQQQTLQIKACRLTLLPL